MGGYQKDAICFGNFATILQWLWKQELAEPIVKKQRMQIIVERQQMNDELQKRNLYLDFKKKDNKYTPF